MKKLILILFLISYTFCKSQNVSLDQQVQKRFNEITIGADTSVFTAFRAMDWLEFKPMFARYKTQLADSAFGISAGDTSGYFLKYISTNNWIQANGRNSVFAIDPYFDASFGKQKEQSSSIYQLSAGLHLQGTVNDKLSYSLAYVYTSERFPNYLDSFVSGKLGPNLGMGYVPGMGKGTLNSNGSYGFQQITGNLTYVPSSHFLASIGNGKNFIGDGYRSLILSDNASNYPFIRLQARYWKLTYNVIYSEMDNPRYLVDGTDQRKYNFMHLLGINFSDRFQMGVFDDVIFYAKDTTIHRGFDVQYLSPIIFMRPQEFAIGSPDNSALGLTAKYKLHKKGYLYSQLFIDDLHIANSTQTHTNFWANKYGVQLGIWNKDVFAVKGLSWRLEWNSVRPYTYDHGFDKPGINYTHDNQSLADPFGANFNEFISIFQYTNQRWYGSLENLLTIRGEQPAGQTYPIGDDLWGGETGVSGGSKTMQGVKNKYFYNQLTAGYLINPRNRLGIEATAVYRHQAAPGVAVSDVFFSIGIKTGLYNFYKDF
jgi:hypothetical protein